MNFKHGMTGTKTNDAWLNMRKRCLNPDHQAYPRYGGRGIKICERWDSFLNFLEDMGEAPEGMTLEREDNDGHYEKGNCKWATQQEQANNRSSARLLTYKGKVQGLQAWADELGLNKRTLRERLERGWSVEQAIEEPLQAKYSKGVKNAS